MNIKEVHQSQAVSSRNGWSWHQTASATKHWSAIKPHRIPDVLSNGGEIHLPLVDDLLENEPLQDFDEGFVKVCIRIPAQKFRIFTAVGMQDVAGSHVCCKLEMTADHELVSNCSSHMRHVQESCVHPSRSSINAVMLCFPQCCPGKYHKHPCGKP